jgi:carbonic anhydrase
MKLRIGSSFTILAVIWAISQTALAQTWSHEPPSRHTAAVQTWSHDPSSQSGPALWGSVAPQYATCGTNTPAGQFQAVGVKQTPIDIEDATALLAVLPEVTFHYNPTPMEVENTGHVVEVPYEAGSYVSIGDSVTDAYFLSQFHFHVPSEHMLNGQQYDGEMHLVHTNRLGETLVIGVFLSKSSEAQASGFDDIASNAPMTVANNTVSGTVNVTDLLPAESLFYTYTGSLTTPPCTEGVRWMVMTNPIQVTSSFIQQLHTIAGQFPGYNGYPNNNRPVQPLGGRKVIAAQ